MKVFYMACDRCGCTIDENKKIERKLFIYNHTVMLDLCEKCQKELEEWKENKENEKK